MPASDPKRTFEIGGHSALMAYTYRPTTTRLDGVMSMAKHLLITRDTKQGIAVGSSAMPLYRNLRPNRKIASIFQDKGILSRWINLSGRSLNV